MHTIGNTPLRSQSTQWSRCQNAQRYNIGLYQVMGVAFTARFSSKAKRENGDA